VSDQIKKNMGREEFFDGWRRSLKRTSGSDTTAAPSISWPARSREAIFPASLPVALTVRCYVKKIKAEAGRGVAPLAT